MKRCNLYLRMLFLKYTEHFIRKTAPHEFNSPKINHKLLVSFCIFQNSSCMGSCHRIHKRQYILQYYCFSLLPFYRPLSWYFLYLFLPYFIKIFQVVQHFYLLYFTKKLLSDCILSQLKGVLLLFASSVTTLYFNCSGSSTS